MVQIKKISLALASLGLLGASAAQAIDIQAGDWKLGIGGNVNGFITSDSCENSPKTIKLSNAALGSLVCTGNSTYGIQNGLLPNEISFTASSRQDDLDVTAVISLWPTIDTTGAAQTGSSGLNSRQGFFTFGDKSWGTVKIGRDLGIFGSDAILSDMTLLSVGGASGGAYGGPTTLGRIGQGYLYADWIPQITYSTPNLSGFNASVGVFQGLTPIGSASALSAVKQPGIQGKASFDLSGSGVSGKVWAGFLTQKLDPTTASPAAVTGYDANAYEIGAKVGAGDFEGVAYYYSGEGVGTTVLFNGGDDGLGNKRKSSGGYLQGTYKIGKVKLGLSYGESKVDQLATDAATGLAKNDSTIGSIYYSLTKSITLVGEVVAAESKNIQGDKNKQTTVALGGIIFF